MQSLKKIHAWAQMKVRLSWNVRQLLAADDFSRRHFSDAFFFLAR